DPPAIGRAAADASPDEMARLPTASALMSTTRITPAIGSDARETNVRRSSKKARAVNPRRAPRECVRYVPYSNRAAGARIRRRLLNRREDFHLTNKRLVATRRYCAKSLGSSKTPTDWIRAKSRVASPS